MATIDGGEGDDTLVGSGTDDWIRGAGGNDVLSGGTGADTLEGGEGDDTLDGGGPNGDNSDNVLRGGDGNDILTSGLSSRLYGDAGDDQLRGSGFSTLTGGEGHDRFYASSFSPGYISTVTDFQDGDVVDLGQLLAFTDYVAGDPFLQGYVRLVQDGADALLQYDYNGFSRGAGFRSVMRLLGIDASSLTAGAFDGFNPQAVSTTHYAMEPEGGSVTWGPGSLLTHVYGGPGDDTATLNLTGGGCETLCRGRSDGHRARRGRRRPVGSAAGGY